MLCSTPAAAAAAPASLSDLPPVKSCHWPHPPITSLGCPALWPVQEIHEISIVPASIPSWLCKEAPRYGCRLVLLASTSVPPTPRPTYEPGHSSSSPAQHFHDDPIPPALNTSPFLRGHFLLWLADGLTCLYSNPDIHFCPILYDQLSFACFSSADS